MYLLLTILSIDVILIIDVMYLVLSILYLVLMYYTS